MRRRQTLLSAITTLTAATGLIYAVIFALGYAGLHSRMAALGFRGIWGFSAEQYLRYALAHTLINAVVSVVCVGSILLPAAYLLSRAIRRFRKNGPGTCRRRLWLDAGFGAAVIAALGWTLVVHKGISDLLLVADIDPESAVYACLAVGKQLPRVLVFGSLCINVALLGWGMYRWWQDRRCHREAIIFWMGLLLGTSAFILGLNLIPVSEGKLFLNMSYPKATVQSKLPQASQRLAAGSERLGGWLVVVTPEAIGILESPPTGTSPSLRVIARSSVSEIQIHPQTRWLKKILEPKLTEFCDTPKTHTMLRKPLYWILSLMAIAMALGLARAHPGARAGQSTATTGEVPIATHLGPDRWQGFFASATASVEDFLLAVAALTESFRGDRHPRTGTQADTVGMDIRLYSLTTGEDRRLTRDGGYRSPHGTPDGCWICFLRHGRLGIMERDASGLRMLDDPRIYHHILGCRMDSGEILLVGADDNYYLVNLLDDTAQRVALDLDTGKTVGVDTLLDLARFSTDGRSVYIRSSETASRLLVNRRDWPEPHLLFRTDRRIADPAWMSGGAEVIYVSSH